MIKSKSVTIVRIRFAFVLRYLQPSREAIPAWQKGRAC